MSAVSPATGVNSPWTIVGGPGSTLGLFNQPRGISGMADGGFVVVDRSARITHFDAQNQPVNVFSMKEHHYGNPKGLCMLPNGNILICDTHYGRMMEMTVDGLEVKEWGKGLGTEPEHFVHPLSATVDAKNGFVYIAEYGSKIDRIQKFKLDGTYVKYWGEFGSDPGQFRRCSGITINPQGIIFVADAVNHRIQSFDANGKLLGSFGTQGTGPGELNFPYDIASDSQGRLYIAEFNNHRVSVFDSDGKFITVLGAAGGDPGQFWSPWSLTVDAKDRLLVSDTANQRIQILDLKSAPAMAMLKKK